MNRIDPKLAATLRQPADLVERRLAKATDLADLERVAARYAIAVTPDIAGAYFFRRCRMNRSLRLLRRVL